MTLRRGFESDSSLAISKGMIKGHARFDSLGERTPIGATAQGEDVWGGTDTTLPEPPAIGEQMTVISSSDADNGATSTGIVIVRIHYLNASGVEMTEDITLNGSTEVDTVATDIKFINDFHAVEVNIASGVRAVAVGAIIIYQKGANTVIYNRIEIGGNKSLVSNRMIPTGKTLFVENWTVSESRVKETSFRLRSNCDPLGSEVVQGFLFKRNALLKGATLSEKIDPPIRICEGAIIKVSAWATGGGGAGSADFSGTLVDNNVIGGPS